MMIGLTPENSIGEIDEPELIQHLIRDWHWGSAVLANFALPPASRLIPELMLTHFGRRDDLDLLCARPSAPAEAVAIQFKLAKVKASTYYTLQPNKLHDLKKLFRQTNPLVELGFHRVFACLVVLIDARDTPPGLAICGGLTEELGPVIDSSISTEGLNARAGFVRVDLVQDSGAAPLTSGEIKGRLLRYATTQPQSRKVSAWVAEQLGAA